MSEMKYTRSDMENLIMLVRVGETIDERMNAYHAILNSFDTQGQRIAHLEARLAESEKAAYDIDETIQHQKQRIAELEAEVARLQEELNDL